MKIVSMPTAGDVALLFVYLMVAHDEAKNRSTSRFRVSGKTFRRIALRSIITDDFLADFLNALLRHGYVGFVFADGIGAIEASAVSGWSLISSKRVESRLRQIEADGFRGLETVQKDVENYKKKKSESG